MTDLSLDQLSYLAAKARLPEKLVLDTAHETVQRFMEEWKDGEGIKALFPKAVEPINRLLGQIPLLGEVKIT